MIFLKFEKIVMSKQGKTYDHCNAQYPILPNLRQGA